MNLLSNYRYFYCCKCTIESTHLIAIALVLYEITGPHMGLYPTSLHVELHLIQC